MSGAYVGVFRARCLNTECGCYDEEYANEERERMAVSAEKEERRDPTTEILPLVDSNGFPLFKF
jgi:hypothetical protein